MKHTLFLLVTVLTLTPAVSVHAQAQLGEDRAPDTDRRDGGTELLLETDPVTFALGGFAAHLRVAPGLTRGWVFGAGVYRMELPEPMIELDPQNRGEGWQSELRLGTGVFVDRYLSGNGGAFVGGQLAVQQYRLGRRGVTGQGDYTAGLAMARLGYLWQPARELGFYVMPWVGAGAVATLGGDSRRLGDERYRVLPAIAFGTLHVGWRL